MRFGTTLSAFALSGVVALATTFNANAADPEFSFKIHHFLSPDAVAQTKMIEPWVERIEEESEGRIEFEIFPAMSLGGTPSGLYRQVRDGDADIIWTEIGLTPGVFPRTEVFELPSVHLGSAKQTNLAIQYSIDLINDDFKDIHPLLIHAHAGNALHIAQPLDVYQTATIEGLKIYTPSRAGKWMIEEMGGVPVELPADTLTEALASGGADGALASFEGVSALNLHEVTTMSAEGRNKERFGTSVFLFAMNSDSYASLPDDLKKIIDSNSGRDFAEEMGDVWDAAETNGKNLQYSSGGSIVRLEADITANMIELSEKVVERWVEDVKAKDIKGQAIVRWARAAIANYKP